jgi:hypothetical protein
MQCWRREYNQVFVYWYYFLLYEALDKADDNAEGINKLAQVS